MHEFITRLDASGDGPRVAVKDIIDVAGVPTTAGCRALAKRAAPADRDAECLRGIRAAGARIVGKANLHELAMLPFGVNPWYGTPVNPLDPALVPGGSSSGSAVAVANEEADVALGSDTGGSVRIPSACCGTFGLKTTHGRVSLDGVWPLAPSLDTVGPMATSVAGLRLGMELLEPGFTVSHDAATVVGRIRTSGASEIEAAIDEALRAAEFEVVDIDASILSGGEAFSAVYFEEMYAVDHALVTQNPDDVGADIAQMVGMADVFRGDAENARAALERWRAEFGAVFERVQVLALPTLPIFPPRIDAIGDDGFVPALLEITTHVAVFNAAGVPATAQPVPVAGSALPASLQLVGPRLSEELLLPTMGRVATAL